MKKLLFIAIAFFVVDFAHAQSYDSIAPYLKTKEIPSFNILQTDSSWFRTQDLPKGQPTVFIYFNPDCGHCQETAKKIGEEMNSFKQVTFVWATYLSPMEEIEAFKKEYKLSGYPNVHFGKDPQYFIPAYFRVEQTPFVALYDGNQQFVKAWPIYFTDKEHKKA
ncbi:MAG: hypothetical protein DI598_14565, partial [Pseudopedobacter saltans]